MAPTFKYVSGLLCLATALFPACSGDSDDEEPGSQAGNGGKAGSGPGGQGGSSGHGGSAGGGGKAGGGAAGSANAGSGGSSAGQAGDDPGGSAGAAGAGGSRGDVIAECLDAPVLDETRTEALQLEGAGVRLALVRREDPDALGTSGTTPWLAQHFALERGAIAECVTSPADLSYTASHHNFDDEMTAKGAEQSWLFTQTRAGYDSPTSWTVEARQQDAVLWGPVTLTLVSCRRLDSDDDCADAYQ